MDAMVIFINLVRFEEVRPGLYCRWVYRHISMNYFYKFIDIKAKKQGAHVIDYYIEHPQTTM